ncbi:BamA/TamA family outer membrane protein [Lacibacter sp. H407]|uniref:BamA/TamA family outer membrane protein n=1 Tax=Lacibacter sp. H407 TaxID=3133423 RepID=UPI0030BBFB88
MSFTRVTITILFSLAAMQIFLSCGAFKKPTRRQYTKVKNFPKGKPFVYFNDIKLEKNQLNKDNSSLLIDGLFNQLDDSMRTVVKNSYVILKRLENPPAFDTTYALQSAQNMEVFLKTMGYYNGKASYAYKMDSVYNNNPDKLQIRVATTFTVTTGPVFRIDSIALIPNDSNRAEIEPIVALTRQYQSESYLQKGDPFSEELISREMNRLVNLYRNNGYYNMTRDALYADVDTVFLALLDPNLALDPIRQFEVFAEALERRKNPLINVYIRTKPATNAYVFQQFTNQNIVVYPEYKGGSNVDSTNFIDSTRNNISIRFEAGKFKPAFIRRNLRLRTDSLYSALKVNQTADELNKLNVWQVVRIQPKIAVNDSTKIDYDLFLIPYKRYTFSTNIESVFNQVQSALSTAGNLIGFGVNFGLQDRNIAKQGIQMSNNIRAGIELGLPPINSGLQATELAFSNSLSTPRIPRWLFTRKSRTWLNRKTFLTTNLSFIDRNINQNGLFAITSVSSTFGWQFQAKDAIWRLSPLNVEYVKLYDLSQTFKDQLDANPFLRNSFNQGFVLGNFNANFSRPQIRIKKRDNHVAGMRVNFEESGALFGRLKKVIPLFDKELFEYVKLDAEVKYQILKPSSTWARWVFRAAAGAGYLYDNDTSSMPFFKQFAGGGPNSMRAWPLRSIGPGASPADIRTGRNQFFSRSGDIIFETNAEYRYKILSIWPNSLILEGALFTDIGNVWNFRNKGNAGNDTVVLNFKNLYRDLSVSVGTGLRLDFVGLFMIRVDVGYRLKNPAFPYVLSNNGWRAPKISVANLFGRSDANRNWRYENINISLGIGYPFNW